MAELMAWEKKARVKDEGLKKVKAIVQSVSHSSLHHSESSQQSVLSYLAGNHSLITTQSLLHPHPQSLAFSLALLPIPPPMLSP